ncbi:unnamed protein product [Microthlaspi erraticum]|uniref:FKB95-like N-terminal Kelch domain-containing protein n=1 Tax=Microthlaspi erraticum TaxID=1685480 RepID=A0A6D2I155_9BRAS|nr:unnamed protein product [Microthlaspi erraticum]
MTVARKGAKSCFFDDKIYAIGGCMNREESTNWGEVFDLKTQTWKPLPKPPLIDDDDDDKVAVFGEKLYFFSKSDARYAYDPKEGRWVPEFGFVGLEATSITGPWCVIGNVMFAEYDKKLKWYNPKYKNWLRVYGLNQVLYSKRRYCHRTIQLVNHGGKLIIVWHEWVWMARDCTSPDLKIWCAVIRLEERLTSRLGPQMWGEVERCNIVVPSVPTSYKLSTCQSISF